MEKTLTCINCPIGCQITVEVEGDQVVQVKGNVCSRGLAYAKQEAVAPRRMVTAVVNVPGRELPLSVKTASPIPKEKIFDCMKAIEAAKIKAPVRMGDIICKDVCSTGVNVVATRDVL